MGFHWFPSMKVWWRYWDMDSRHAVEWVQKNVREMDGVYLVDVDADAIRNAEDGNTSWLKEDILEVFPGYGKKGLKDWKWGLYCMNILVFVGESRECLEEKKRDFLCPKVISIKRVVDKSWFDKWEIRLLKEGELNGDD
jgi:hypothetical protein